MISKRIHPEGSNVARGDTLRHPGNEMRSGTRGEQVSAGGAEKRADRKDGIEPAATGDVAPDASDRDDD